MTPEKVQTLSHNVVSCTPLPSGIHTEWIGSYKSNYHTSTAMTITSIDSVMGSVSYRVWQCVAQSVVVCRIECGIVFQIIVCLLSFFCQSLYCLSVFYCKSYDYLFGILWSLYCLSVFYCKSCDYLFGILWSLYCLSVFYCKSSDYLFGILWSLYCLSVFYCKSSDYLFGILLVIVLSVLLLL